MTSSVTPTYLRFFIMVLSFHPETARCVQSTAFSNQRMETAASIVREDENFANTAAEALRFWT